MLKKIDISGCKAYPLGRAERELGVLLDIAMHVLMPRGMLCSLITDKLFNITSSLFQMEGGGAESEDLYCFNLLCWELIHDHSQF